MPICWKATAFGAICRYVWDTEGGGDGLGVTGELLELQKPCRAATTEQ